jgi:hypothetical protein
MSKLLHNLTAQRKLNLKPYPGGRRRALIAFRKTIISDDLKQRGKAAAARRATEQTLKT